MGRFRFQSWCGLCGIGAAVLAIGCSADDPLRQAIEGTVTVDGQLAGEGMLLFCPTNGTHGPSASVGVERGRYRMDQSRGPYVGDHGVRFTPRHVHPPDESSTIPIGSHTANRDAPSGQHCVDDSHDSATPEQYEMQVEVRAGQLNLYFTSAPEFPMDRDSVFDDSTR